MPTSSMPPPSTISGPSKTRRKQLLPSVRRQPSSAPNINFYLMLDSSTSMLLPATTAGISTMVSKVGCALACHEADFTDSENTVQYAGWGTMDSYTYAEKNGITLRIDNVRTAAQSLVTTAQNTMATYNATASAGDRITYQMAAYTFRRSPHQPGRSHADDKQRREHLAGKRYFDDCAAADGRQRLSADQPESYTSPTKTSPMPRSRRSRSTMQKEIS